MKEVIPRVIPDNWVLCLDLLRPYVGLTYSAVKEIDPKFAAGLPVLLSTKNFDKYFI